MVVDGCGLVVGDGDFDVVGVGVCDLCVVYG